MRKSVGTKLFLHVLAFGLLVGAFALFVHPSFAQTSDTEVQISESQIGFKIPNFADILTFIIRVFFVIAGLAALLFLLLGAFGWVVSGGEKDAITAARDKIQAAVVGLILIVAVLAIIVTLERIVFRERICLGISCPVKIPSLVGSCIPHPDGTPAKCCPSISTSTAVTAAAADAGGVLTPVCCSVLDDRGYCLTSP